LLENPSPGQTQKIAWSDLLKLGNNYQLREKILKSIRSIDPLPGKIFKSSTQNKRHKVIVKNFAKNFPEYIDFYAQTCIKYVSGEKKFPNGRPALECDDLFKLSKKLTHLPDPVVELYRKYKNFEI